LAILLHQNGRSKEAEAAWRDALVVLQKLAADFPKVPEYQYRVAGTLSALATLLRARDRPADAESAYREVLALWKQLATDFPEVPSYRQQFKKLLAELKAKQNKSEVGKQGSNMK
jgi:hypothetical protein